MEMIQEAVEEFLKHVENHWPNLPKKENRKNFVRHFFSNWEDTLSFIVDSYYLKLWLPAVQGIETFTQIQIGGGRTIIIKIYLQSWCGGNNAPHHFLL